MAQGLTKPSECQHSIDLLEQAVPAAPEAGEHLDVSFMSKSFCMVGLPLRRQFVKDPNTKKSLVPPVEVTEFTRTDERFSLQISAAKYTLPDRDGVKSVPFQVGLPFGARARLLIIWANTQARLTNSRWLEIGKIKDWLDETGSSNASAYAAAKEQLFRLAFARFQMMLLDRGQKQTYFRSNQLISSAIFDQEDLINYANGELSKVRYPLGIELSEEAHKTFTSNNVVAVSTQQLREISNNAMSIDIFLFLNFKLPQIPFGKSEVVSWSNLVKQFGNSETSTRFRYVFEDSIRHAMRAYSGANVELTDKGLEMRYSDPAEIRKTMIAVPRLKLIEAAQEPKQTRVRNRIAPPTRGEQSEMDF